MMNVTRNALRNTVPADCPLRLIWNAPSRLSTFGGLFSEQPRRPEDKDDNQQREHLRFGPARVPDPIGEGGHQPDQHAAEEGALNVADATHHGSCEAVQAIPKALEEPG